MLPQAPARAAHSCTYKRVGLSLHNPLGTGSSVSHSFPTTASALLIFLNLKAELSGFYIILQCVLICIVIAEELNDLGIPELVLPPLP